MRKFLFDLFRMMSQLFLGFKPINSKSGYLFMNSLKTEQVLKPQSMKIFLPVASTVSN